MHKRSALISRKNSLVDILCKLFAAEYHTAARTAKGLVRRRRNDIGVGHRAWVKPGGNESRNVRHIDHEVCPDTLRDLRNAFEIYYPRISRCTGNYKLRQAFTCATLKRVVINHSVGIGYPV